MYFLCPLNVKSMLYFAFYYINLTQFFIKSPLQCFSNLNLKFFQIYGTFWHFISLKWLYSVPVFIVPAKSPSWNQEDDIFFKPKNAWGLKSKEWDRWSKRRVQSERAWQRDGMGRVCPPCGCCSAVQGVDSSRPNKKRGGETAKRER